jgi:putative spermidine/putrescine transport system ATP-binding protein
MSVKTFPCSKPILRLENVTKHYGAVIAVEEVNLEITEGEFLTLLGPSGSGKTTILNLCAGTVEPSSGTLWLREKDATHIPPNKRGLGMVFQNYALMPHMTVFENIAFPLRIRKTARDEIRRKVAKALEIVQLPQLGGRKPRELSGGQQQRVALARCVVYNPAMILMDEPLGALDKNLREQMQLEIKRLHKDLNITILYVTHDQEEALSMSDRIVLMRKGRVEQQGSPSDLYFRPNSLFAANFLGDSNIFRVRVREIRDVILLELDANHHFLVKGDYSGKIGDEVYLLVRPEHVRFTEGNEPNKSQNVIEGTVVDTIFIAGVAKTYLRLNDGSSFVVKDFASNNEIVRRTGSKVRVSWHPSDSRVLLPESNNSG